MIKKRYIICAAIKYKGQVILGHNHGDILQNIKLVEGDYIYQENQGFIDNQGIFLTRKEAFKIAIENGQLNKEDFSDKEDSLRSEMIGNRLWLLKEIY